MEDSDYSEQSETSESEDELEEAPAFTRRNHVYNEMDVHTKNNKKKSRIDALYAEHMREAGKDKKLRALRDQLLAEINSNIEKSREEDNQDLASEHTADLEKLKVKSIKLRTAHPGLAVFSADNFGCLFSDNVCSLRYFIQAESDIDKIWSSFFVDSLNACGLPDTLPDSIIASPNFDAIMQWLLDMLSIRSDTKRIMTILNNLQLKRKTAACWKPSAIGLLRLLVNLGADPQELTEGQQIFTQDEIRKHLVKVNDGSMKRLCKDKMNSGRFQAVLSVLATALLGRSVVDKDHLNLMFYMLAKASLDTSLDKNVAHQFRKCFAAIINHYSDSDWPSVVPKLCRQLSHVTHHHHNKVYLAGSFIAEPRGSYLQMCLSYTFLYNQLISGTPKLEDLKCQDVQLADLTELGIPAEKDKPSTLAVSLYNLVNKDRYKAFSVLRLLEMSVGNIVKRAAVEKKQLEYLQSQLTLVQKTIRDKVCELDLSKMKDMMYRMTVKWSLALQDQRKNEGSLFSWATATTHQLVTPEILMDKKEQNLTDKGEDISTEINQQNEAQ